MRTRVASMLTGVYVLQLIGNIVWCLHSASSQQTMRPAQAWLQAESQFIDLGTVTCASSIRTTIAVRNVGSRSCTIEKVVTSCGCTNASLQEGTVIAPDESVPVEILLEVPRKSGVLSSGLTIVWRDAAAERCDYTIVLTGTVECSPEQEKQESVTLVTPTPDPLFRTEAATVTADSVRDHSKPVEQERLR